MTKEDRKTTNEPSVLTRAGHAVVRNLPGMRIIKTALAVLLALLIDQLRGADFVYNAAIAAIVCMQPDLATTLESGRNRVMGTLIAGIYGYLFLLIAVQKLGVNQNSLFFYVLVAVLLLPLMQGLILLKLPGSVKISSIVFVLICVSSGREDPLIFSANRVLDTLIGIGIAMFVNWLPFLTSWGNRLQEAKGKAAKHPKNNG